MGNTMPPTDSTLLNDWIPEGGGDFDVIAIGLQESTYKSEKVSETLARADSWKPDDLDEEDEEVDTDDGVEEEEESKPPLRRASSHKSLPVADDGDVVDSEASQSKGRVHSSSAASEPDSDTTNGAIKRSDVIVKRSRTKKSIRKVSKMVRQLSSNLDYPFSKQIHQHLGKSYAVVGKVELMEMRLFVYVHERNNVNDVEKLAIPTGLGSVIGNKCATILGAQFCQKNVSIDLQFDHCFWFGDLNYRVDLSYTAPGHRSHEKHCAEVMTLVRAKKWELLNRNDQLRRQVEGQKALAGWELPPALFPPTFKRVRHSLDEYLVRFHSLERVPSYCDRVLHKSLPGLRGNVKLQRFSCIEAIATSDHKPVVAAFHVGRTPSIQVSAAPPLAKPTLVEITELAGKDLLGLDMAGLSDPYVKFYSVPSNALQVDASGSHPSTATISNTCSPSWRNDQVPKLHVLCDHERDVKRVHLTLVFMDYDATSKDDLMGRRLTGADVADAAGVTSLSLEKFCLGRPRFLPFEAPVVRHGKPAGVVTGKLRITLPHQASLISEDDGPQAIRMAGCHCSLS
ncbi:hypothetical protein BBJ28_00017551 [Nothophytophthora sp. Chile5]|nr:hypothetical protein BBJ28_00017551 [Nothophytophthora sp. Chile5]